MRELLVDLVGPVSGLTDPRVLAIQTIQVLASVVQPLFISGIPLSIYGVDFEDDSNRREYVGLLVSGLAARDV